MQTCYTDRRKTSLIVIHVTSQLNHRLFEVVLKFNKQYHWRSKLYVPHDDFRFLSLLPNFVQMLIMEIQMQLHILFASFCIATSFPEVILGMWQHGVQCRIRCKTWTFRTFVKVAKSQNVFFDIYKKKI